MDVTSNELLRRKAVSESFMKGTSSDGDATFSSASAENVPSPGLSCAVSVGEKRKRNDDVGICNTKSPGVVRSIRGESNDNGDGERRVELVQPKKYESSSGVKFIDFDRLREEEKFAVGQIWALFDTPDKVPRQYAMIRKVSAPSFGLRITYLEPDPDDEREIQWFEQDLPVSAGKFRLGNSQNTEDRSVFSHVMHCNGGSNSGHLILSPRKGETWALFKNWDINWSSEPDSHRKYEYEVVEILSDYAGGSGGVSVAILHKAKDFASVFFRMGFGDAEVSQILPHSLYRFSHRIPSYKMKRVEVKGVPRDAYELDQAALPESMEEKVVPPYLYAKPKPEALCVRRNGKVFQTGQIWSFCSGNVNLPLYYCRIQKITLIQASVQEPEFKIQVCRLKAMPFPEDVIQWEDKKMPVGCGTFWVYKSPLAFSPDDVVQQVVPQISMDGNEYTILPKIGELWAIYRTWDPQITFSELENKHMDFDIVEVLGDALEYKVLALEPALLSHEDVKKKFFSRAAERKPSHHRCNDEDGSEVIFTIPKSKMLRFLHRIPASRVTKNIDGEMKELFEVDSRALPYLGKY
ncbi:unnamed protein product [Microthlaspi erraticum]|uniref:DUF3444 domain-containing protein n=1 Tax=Microthlaspi erraticum TaxID=1685480 RepID=A0A6D2LP90_9BRAS|nr:unnamed protein product [Microthlaspi erraticum]